MKYLCIVLYFTVCGAAMAAVSPCPDKDDLIHGLNVERESFEAEKEVFVAGKYWDVLTTESFKLRSGCNMPNFFQRLACYAQDKKLRFLSIPFGTRDRLGRQHCKYQVYVTGEIGVYGEITLRKK